MEQIANISNLKKSEIDGIVNRIGYFRDIGIKVIDSHVYIVFRD